MSEQPKAGTLMRCVDASVRRTADSALYSDFEKKRAGIIEVMEILTVREVLQYNPFGGAWAVRFEEIERGIEGISRYRGKKLYDFDRPFFLDRFVVIRNDDDGDKALPTPTQSPQREIA